jgi:signal transduction histidine kinase
VSKVKVLGLQSSESRYIQTLLWGRWLVLVGGLLLVVVFELTEGHLISDPALYAEILLYGVAVPSVTWLFLTVLAQLTTRHLKSESKFQLYQHITRKLSLYRRWDELTSFVTQFPAEFLPVVRASLYIYDQKNKRFDLTADWSSNGAHAVEHSFSLNVCKTCAAFASTGGQPLTQCDRPARRLAREKPPGEYCLRLSHENLLVGILKLRTPPGKTFSPDQIEFANMIAPEIALALILAIAYPKQMVQVRVEAQLVERNRIAYELHNSLAQQLGYLHFSLDQLAGDSYFSANSAAQAELEKLRQLADDAYEHVHRYLLSLRLEDATDLPHAIADFAQQVARQAGLKIEIATHGAPQSLSTQMCQSVFNLVQEALNNVKKHANARQVRIAVNWSAEDLEISLADDGAGFDPSTSAPRPGRFGLAMMREQVASLRGELMIDSSPRNGGTRLKFKIPLQGQPAQAQEGLPLYTTPGAFEEKSYSGSSEEILHGR